MTRLKKRKITFLLRLAALLLFPVLTALAVRSFPAVRDFVRQTGSIRIESHQVVSTSATSADFSTLQTTTSAASSGVIQQSTDILTETVSPLEISSDGGEKPYPTSWSAGGSILRTTYGHFSGTSFFDLDNGGQVNNQTSIPNETLLSESRCPVDFSVDTGQPLVLIYHTHTTESFEPYVRDFYDADFNYRTTDESKNMVMVGDAIQAELEAHGIGVIHARDIHDYPSYNGSYSRSRETVQAILEQYPSIKVVLDIHRDAVSGSGVAYQPYVEIDGKEAAQIMIISGCDDGTLNMPDFMKNFHFACRLQEQLESDYSGLTRPILFDYRHYNQDLTTGSLLIEVGSHGNTLEQVQYSGQLIGSSLARLLESLSS